MADNLQIVKQRLAALIAQPSVSCFDAALDTSNLGVVDLLDEWLTDAGFAVQRQTVNEAPRKLNLIARLGHGEGGLVLSGHTDTVPFDEGRWTSDPFRLDERDGRWYGLGSADMKCFFPIVMAALDGVDRARLRRPLTVIATADEESSMAGARCLADCGSQLGSYALIGEPTALIPVRKHKGIVIARIEIIGRSGHSSEPALGANALDCMVDVIGDLVAWRERAAGHYADDDFKVPMPTLNLGRIQGGDSPNRICADCELLFDIRVTPPMVIDDAVDELRERVEARCAAAGVRGALTLPMAPLPALDTPADSALVSALETLSGSPARTVAFATEAPFFNALGCQSVIFGPGDIATAHQPDEYVEIDKVARMIEILRPLIERFCCDE
ncbi:MAG: acetylornithine deacetylase [Gammaproteobacteria bacterium]